MAGRQLTAAWLAFGLIAAACTSGPATPSGSPAPTGTPIATSAPSTASPLPTGPATSAPTPPVVTPTLAPTPSPAATGFPRGSVIVTFQVEQEQYRVLLTDPLDILIANRLLAGEEAPPIPNGLIVRGLPEVNVGWSWHIDPDSIEFADVTTEVCDGLPSFVEDGSLTSDRYCPWGAEVVAVEPANR